MPFRDREPSSEELVDVPGRIGRPRNVGRARWPPSKADRPPARWQSVAVTNALSATAEPPPLFSEETAAVRFWPYVDKTTGPVHPTLGRCWIWARARNRWEYGYFGARGARVAAHRYALELTVGAIGSAYACHKCNNPPCVNPAHLYPGDAQSNADDAREARTQRMAERLAATEAAGEPTTLPPGWAPLTFGADPE